MPSHASAASSPADIFTINLDTYDSYSDKDEAAFVAETRSALASAGSARFDEILREAAHELKRKCAHLPKDQKERAFHSFFNQMKGIARMQEEEIEARVTLEKREREELQRAKTISWSLSESGASAMGLGTLATGVGHVGNGPSSSSTSGPSASSSASNSRMQLSYSTSAATTVMYSFDDSALEEQRKLWDEIHKNPQSHAQAMPLPPRRSSASVDESVSDGELTDRPVSGVAVSKGKGKTNASGCEFHVSFISFLHNCFDVLFHCVHFPPRFHPFLLPNEPHNHFSHYLIQAQAICVYHRPTSLCFPFCPKFTNFNHGPHSVDCERLFALSHFHFPCRPLEPSQTLALFSFPVLSVLSVTVKPIADEPVSFSRSVLPSTSYCNSTNSHGSTYVRTSIGPFLPSFRTVAWWCLMPVPRLG